MCHASQIYQFAGIGVSLTKIPFKNTAKYAADFDGLLPTLVQHVEMKMSMRF